MITRDDGKLYTDMVQSMINANAQRIFKVGKISDINFIKSNVDIIFNDNSMVTARIENAYNYFVGDDVLVWEQQIAGRQGSSDFFVITKLSGVPVPPNGNQLVSNGDFYYGLNSWTNYGCNIALSSTIKLSGDYALKISPKYLYEPCYIYQLIDVPLIPGEIYVQTMTAYSPCSADIQIFLDGVWKLDDESYTIYTGSKYTKSNEQSITLLDNWKTIYTVNRCPEYGVRLQVKFGAIFESMDDYIIVDNLSLFGKSIFIPRDTVKDIGESSTPGIPTGVTVESEELVQDENGEKVIELLLDWTGVADMYEIAYVRASEAT